MSKYPINKGGSTARVQRIRKKHFARPATICIDRDEMYTKIMRETEGERMELRVAKASKYIFENIGTPIEDDELIVGAPQSQVYASALYPELGCGWLIDELDQLPTRAQDKFLITEEQKEVMRKDIFPYWENKSLSFKANKQLGPEMAMMIQTGQFHAFWGENSGGHHQPDHAYVLSTGFEQIRENARKRLEDFTELYYPDLRHIDFLNALILVCDGIIAWGKHYADTARAMAEKETDPKRKKELFEIAEVCDQVPAKPARTFREAVQFTFFIQAMSYTESKNQACAIMRFDQYTYPYYKADLEAGRITEAEARELVELFWIKCDEILHLNSGSGSMFYPGYMTFQNISVGGMDADGNDAINDISYMMLAATRDLTLHSPTLVAIIHDGTPDEFYRACIECYRKGSGGMPAMINADIGKLGLGSSNRPHQAPAEELNDGAAMGCVSYCKPGTAAGIDCGVCNMGQDFEKMLYNGISPLLKTQVGPATGDPRSFKTFDECYDAFKNQLKYTIKNLVKANIKLWRLHEEEFPQHLESLLQPYPIQKAERALSPYQGGKGPWDTGGCKYPVGASFLPIGMATIADSLAVIKKCIYEDKTLTWDELLTALGNNWHGYEDLRQMVMNTVPKYGNDDDYVDSIAKDLHDFLFEYMMGECDPYKTEFLQPNFMIINSRVPMGMLVGATPNGRKACQPLSDNLCPTNGVEQNGVTGVMNTILKYRPEYQLQTLLNLRFTTSSIEGENEQKWIDLMKAYFKKGGYHAQYNFVSTDTLKEAQKTPEEYKDLTIRIAGFSAYFTQLAKPSQDNLITRYEHHV